MSALERLWKDRMDIYRYVNYTVNKVTKSRKEPKGSNVKCHFSKGSLTNAGENGVPTLVNSYTLFCGLDAGLMEGDEIVVTQRNGRQVTLSVGEGFPFAAHMEFDVKRSEKI